MNRIERDKLFFTEAKRQIDELKKQNKEMFEALKRVRLGIGMIPHNWDYNEREFMPQIIELLKEMES